MQQMEKCSRRPITREWVAKAEACYATADRSLRARINVNYEAACFHARQCAEMYLKAVSQEQGQRFERCHDLVAILKHIEPDSLEVAPLGPATKALNGCDLTLLYPGKYVNRDEARAAMKNCDLIREAARRALRSCKPPERKARRVQGISARLSPEKKRHAGSSGR